MLSAVTHFDTEFTPILSCWRVHVNMFGIYVSSFSLTLTLQLDQQFGTYGHYGIIRITAHTT
jgi:hypothetical protein